MKKILSRVSAPRPPSEKSTQAVAAIIIALFSLAILTFLPQMGTADPPEGGPQLAQPRLDGGSPIQRERINDYIGRIQQETIEETEANVGRREDLLTRISGRLNDDTPEPMFLMCLANLRLARLHAHAVSTGNGADLAERIFQLHFKKLEADVTWVADHWARGEHPPSPARPIWEHELGTAAGVFLSMEHASAEDTLARIDQWLALGRQIEQVLRRIDFKYVESEDPRIQQIRASGAPIADILWADMKMYVRPQPLFLVNVYQRLAERHGPPGAAAELAPPHLRHSRLGHPMDWIAWNGHTNPLDFTHQSGGVPIDREASLGAFTVFSIWNISGDRTKLQLTEQMRQRLDASLGLVNK